MRLFAKKEDLIVNEFQKDEIIYRVRVYSEDLKKVV